MRESSTRKTGLLLMAGGFLLALITILSTPRHGEGAVFVALMISAVGAIMRWGRWALPVPFALILILVLDSEGYRIYGSPRIIETRVLQSPRIITHLEPPNRIRFADGGTTSVYGVQILRPLDLTSDPTTLRKKSLSIDDALTLLSLNKGWREKEQLTLEAEEAERLEDGSCKFNISVRNVYCCGNSFFASFWPKDLPSHRSEDLGVLLIQSRAARATGVTVPRDYTSYTAELQQWDKQVNK